MAEAQPLSQEQSVELMPPILSRERINFIQQNIRDRHFSDASSAEVSALCTAVLRLLTAAEHLPAETAARETAERERDDYLAEWGKCTHEADEWQARAEAAERDRDEAIAARKQMHAEWVEAKLSAQGAQYDRKRWYEAEHSARVLADALREAVQFVNDLEASGTADCSDAMLDDMSSRWKAALQSREGQGGC